MATTVNLVPASSTGVANCIPFGNNTSFGFTGFIYRNVPPFLLISGGTISFDLGGLNDVDVRRNIYLAVANTNPTAPSSCSDGEPSQNIAATSWTQVVSDTQIPSNPMGNNIVGDFELTYVAEATFSFPGGGLIVGFGASPPGTYADNGCEQVLSQTDCSDSSGFFYSRFCMEPDQALGTLDDGSTGCTGRYSSLGGMKIFSLDTCANGTIEAGEQCDDGNSISGDGCSSGCQIEPCYGCSGEPSTCFTLPDASSCDDGLFCNGADTCSSGTCTVHVGDPCTGGVECNNVCNESTNSCAVPNGTPCTDDGNVCSDDVCNGGMCTHPNNFNACDDGLFCDGQDYCLGGSCDGHYGDPCIFGPQCNNVCDESTDMCTPTLVGTPCVDDGNVCTNDQCDGLGACMHPPGPSGVPCPDDGYECTNDKCDGAGTCGHPPIANGTPCSSDGNQCTDDECDGAGICGHPPVMNGTACDDSDACTQTDNCQSGSCVGTNPIVCPAPLCRAAGNCDPTSGTCSSCPVGYSPGNGGCQKTYAIDASLLDNQFVCSGVNRYNSCGGAPFGFHWSDTAGSIVGAVLQVDVQIEAGVHCSSAGRNVTLNANPIGTYTTPYDCTCTPTHTPQLLADVDTSTYAKGGANAVSIDSDGCDGMSEDSDGFYALVTVTYQDLGLPLAIETGCRQAGKSKLKYKNSATDTKDKLKWKWGKGDATTQAEFGDPTGMADYELCIFGETSGSPTLLISADVPAGASLWSAVGTSGYKYNDVAATHGGMKGILLRSGAAGKSKLLVKGKGTGLSDPTLPFAPGTTGIRAQLTNQSNGKCWESEFPLSSVTVNEGGIKASTP